MESILQHLGFPLTIAIIFIGIAIARRIGSDDALEIDDLRKQNARLQAELKKFQQRDVQESKLTDAVK